MKLTLAAVALLASGGLAMAQTAGTVPPNNTAPQNNTATPGNTNLNNGLAGAPNPTGGAQTPGSTVYTAPTASTANPGTTQTHNTAQRNRRAPVPGANSFTMGQARSRITAAGYTNVTGLKKDRQGVWRGQAEKDGNTVPVSLDYQGNVTSGQQ